MVGETTAAFRRGDFAEVIRTFDRHFGASTYSLQSLFRDEQRKVIKRVLNASIIEAENAFRQVHDNHLPTMHFLAGMGAPLPRVFEVAAEFLLNTDLRRDLPGRGAQPGTHQEPVCRVRERCAVASTPPAWPIGCARPWPAWPKDCAANPTTWPCSVPWKKWWTWLVR